MADLSLSLGRPGLKRDALLPLLDTLADLQRQQISAPTLPELADTTHMDLRSLLEVLFVGGGIAAVKEFFSNHAYTVSQPCRGTAFENVVVGIKYIDGINRLWRPRWAREARGRFYAYDATAAEGERVICLKDALQRGVEVLTGCHAVTETQDLQKGAYEHLDDVQQTCMAAFASPEGVPMDAYLSGKVDGSLLIVNAYPRGTRESLMMSDILATCGDPFAQVLTDACVDQDGPLITVATQGTLLIGEHMQDYLVTALQALLGTIAEKATTRAGVLRTWAQQAPRLVATVHKFLADADLEGKRVHLCFEAVCKDRRTVMGLLHSELAVSYDHDAFNLLGAMVADPETGISQYIPHFDLPATVFAQPIRCHIRSTSEVFDIMADMDRVVLGELDKTTFMTRYGFPEDADIHMEGWVLLTPLPDGSGYDYAKIKTNLYYKCHKVHSEHVSELLALPASAATTYPILHVLREFHEKAETRFRRVIAACRDMLTAEVALGSQGVFFAALVPKAQARVLEAVAAPEDQAKMDVVMRMFLSACPKVFTKVVSAIVRTVWEYEEGAPVPEDFLTLIRHTMIKQTAWRCPLSNAVMKEAMKDLYGILVESVVPA